MINRLAICAAAFYVFSGISIALSADPMLITGGTTKLDTYEKDGVEFFALSIEPKAERSWRRSLTLTLPSPSMSSPSEPEEPNWPRSFRRSLTLTCAWTTTTQLVSARDNSARELPEPGP